MIVNICHQKKTLYSCMSRINIFRVGKLNEITFSLRGQVFSSNTELAKEILFYKYSSWFYNSVHGTYSKSLPMTHLNRKPRYPGHIVTFHNVMIWSGAHLNCGGGDQQQEEADGKNNNIRYRTEDPRSLAV